MRALRPGEASAKRTLRSCSHRRSLAINDYGTGGNDAKTACMFALLADINKNAGVPYNRLAVGFQSHVTAAPGQFPSKAALEANFKKLAALGANAMITEIDIKISGTSSANERYQAAIWGDFLDVRARVLALWPVRC
jgi:endo-1,4-beta-xylanase